MQKLVISLEEAEKLQTLYAELPKAQQKIADALCANGKPLEGERLAKLLSAQDAERGIFRQINDIMGVK